MIAPVIECQDLELVDDGREILHGLSFHLDLGQGCLVVAGSSRVARMLLRVCCTLVPPTSGRISWFGRSLDSLDESQIFGLRTRIGWVQRNSRLISNMTLFDNIVLGLVYHQDLTVTEARSKVKDLLVRLGLQDQIQLRPAEVSPEKLRLAVYAREMAKRPQLFLLESPVADLEHDFELVMKDISTLVEKKQAAFMITGASGKTSLGLVDWVLVLNEHSYRIWSVDEFDPAYVTPGRERKEDFPG